MQYQLVKTPFGNFAAYTYMRNEWEDRGHQTIHLEPLGELAELPLKESYDGQPTLDHDALDAEGARQFPDQAGSIWKPRPSFEINRKHYSGTLEIKFGTYTASSHYDPSMNGKPYARVSSYSTLGEGLTDSAREKLAAWIIEHKDEILTPEFLALDAYDRAQANYRHAEESVKKAQAALAEAEQHLTSAAQTEAETLLALREIEKSAS